LILIPTPLPTHLPYAPFWSAPPQQFSLTSMSLVLYCFDVWDLDSAYDRQKDSSCLLNLDFTLHADLQLHPLSFKWHNFILLYGWIILQWKGGRERETERHCLFHSLVDFITWLLRFFQYMLRSGTAGSKCSSTLTFEYPPYWHL
jgi:hypothetical protein